MGASDDRRGSSMRRRAETHTSGFERTSVILPEGFQSFKISSAGVKRLDFMPYVVGSVPGLQKNADPGKLHPELTYFVHKNIGVEEDSYVCNAKTFGEPCYICEWRAAQSRRPGADAELIKSLEPKERQLWIVYDYNEPDKGFQIWDQSFHLFGKQMDARIKDSDIDDGYDWFFHPGKGMIVRAGFAEKSFGGRNFYECTTLDFKARESQYGREVLEQLPDLEQCLVKTDYEKLKSIFLQVDYSQSGAGEEATSNRPAKAAPAKARPAKAAPAAQTTDDGGWGEDEQQEATPAQQPAKARPQKAAAPAPAADDGGWGEDNTPAQAPAKAAAPKGKPQQAAPPPTDADWDDDTTQATPAQQPAKAAAKAAPKGKPQAAPPADDDWDA